MIDIDKLLDIDISLKCVSCERSLSTNLNDLKHEIHCECGHLLNSGGSSYIKMKDAIEGSSNAYVKRFLTH